MSSRLQQFALYGAGIALLFNPWCLQLVSALGVSLLAYVSTVTLIPRVGDAFIRRGFSGKDMNKAEKKIIPETMGVVCALVYFICMIVFIPFLFYKYLVPNGVKPTSEVGWMNRERAIASHFPHNHLVEYLAALLSILSISLLGILDDLFDIRWRHKFFLPAIAAIPLLVVYYVDCDKTYVSVPTVLRPFLSRSIVDLGVLYYMYMAAVAIFCPNSINIIAGINGVEAGQSLVLAIMVCLNDVLFLVRPGTTTDAIHLHLLSLYLLLPLVAVTLGLLKYNWWPSRVFVGDTYCYFAGMVLAVAGILGHFSKTLLLFFLPQIFNFVLSIPQLFGLVPCPRHRLPRFNPETGLLQNSYVDFTDTPNLPKKTKLSILLFERLRLIKVEYEPKTGRILRCTNFTIINFLLAHLGTMREDHLTMVVMALQFGVGVFALFFRHVLAPIAYRNDNL
ncbi:UDP-N-acetylglucosamine-dolichyl-phosphateN-acetylglucosaminephosphotransferase [Schizosaccharomyces japonicus yFS275]|uniref:UDP-N-acetylglucosamine--dolichyl-phosphate N-acetylglucosaminephosphotransferase n=1 Tax=Schizosaccharomyces japonicus (strain yFS275 / FY16936) TaxID=402676 RepID=B6JWZ9_SCHJY|nr:UDP-N-acetylglucosamine-dolichyl-phosphateN-acetylglucosaminephosphotransferase [Schizosaccharomyces japonicus yFS275]EEB05900.1 UDP-N-acetylglucosamine-dolichyl-phosphateN-acetylglucosaminephosphotransferase [Schizosaccharomyces japonicus yFS275]